MISLKTFYPRSRPWLSIILLFSGLLLVACQRLSTAPKVTPVDKGLLQLEQTIPLPAVAGRIDHLATDIVGHRLFIAALGNHTVEVIDLAAGKRIHTITGLAEPQGVLFLPDFNQIYVTSGGSGTCTVFDGTSFTLLKQLTCGADADNLRFDAATQTIYVGAGNGLLGSFRTRQQERLPDIPLPGHPEA